MICSVLRTQDVVICSVNKPVGWYPLYVSLLVGVLYLTVSKKLISLIKNLKVDLIDGWTSLICCVKSNSWSNVPINIIKI